MHKYIEYISDLLFLHDCVIVPGLGAFICNRTSAYVDEKSGRICPPGRDIVFNRHLTRNDGLLASRIAAGEHIPYDKAVLQLSLFCEELKVRLNRGQRIPFGNLGTFRTDRRSRLLFEAGSTNLYAEAIGMHPVALPAARATAHPAHGTHRTHRPLPAQGTAPAYINMESPDNIFLRLLKYGLAAAVIAGMAVISRLGIFHDPANTPVQCTALPAALPAAHGDAGYDSVISPATDYVDYDPFADLLP